MPQPRMAITAAPGPRSVTPARSMAAERLVSSRWRVRTLDLLGALSSGLDLAGGHPEGHAQRTAYLASRLASASACDGDDRATLLYAALLKDVGGTSETPHRSASRDIVALRAARGVEIARHLALPASVGMVIGASREQWDGRGGPSGLVHEEIPLLGRILAVAEGAEIGLRDDGPAGAARLLRSRRGTRYDPALVDLMVSLGRLGLWRELGAGSDCAAPKLADLEPVHLVRMSDRAGIDRVALTFADLVDARNPTQGRHAARVGIVAARVATGLGLPEGAVVDLRRAGLLHDIGKLGIPAAIFDKPAELTAVERHTVAAHPHLGAAILERCTTLAPLADLVRHHHERLDARDRFPELETPVRSMSARVLAIADRYAGMTAERPYRAALTREQALAILDATVGDVLAREALRALGSAV